MLLTLGATAQISIEQQVIGSTGSYQVGPSMTLSSTVGEAVVQTLFSTSMILTQGFQQPQSFTDSLLTYEMINESCKGAKNGSIFVNNVLGCPGPYQVIITAIDDSLTILEASELGAGIYNVNITGGNTSTNNCSYSTQLTVGLDSDEECQLKFYSGITPNNDGKNDVWIIENIELYPENTVQIFNRWGTEVWFEKNYDNDNVIWKGNTGNKDEGFQMASATYFYVAKVGGKIYKGWVEITR
jgi:gliding motility-associated-like protein